MRLSPATRNLLRAGVGVTLAFIYIPLLVIFVYAFNGGTTLKWPLDGLTTEWFGKALEDDGERGGERQVVGVVGEDDVADELRVG